ncbi:MAG: DNA-binding protein WhiA [Clostridiales bacterium]|nr:DNA-binding protein WhiA [Clostridiales bacterium]
MSFSRSSKEEILKVEFEDDSCALAFLSGLIHSCGQIEKSGSKIYIKIVSDVESLFSYCQKIIKKLYGDNVEAEISENYNINKNTYFEIAFEVEKFKPLLLDVGVVEISESGLSFNFDIDNHLLIEDEAKRAFIKGVYIGASTSSIKLSAETYQSCGSGYHLEFVSQSHKFLIDFSNILAEYNIIGKIFERKNSFVLYVKDVNTIQDLLALVGANESVLNLSNEIITRELRNKVNRQVNCINANINKTVEASMKQVNAINTIINTIGLESLPEDLQEVAVLRLANKEESLDELIKLSTIQLTRSGLNHRFRKLIKIASSLEE